MANKKRVTPIISEKSEGTMFKTMLQMELAAMDTPPLATPDEVLQGISKASNKSIDTPKTYGRPLKESAIGRVKFTTALQPLYVKWLKHEAANTGVSVADVVELAFAAYKYEKDKNR